jgi:TolA-binding protein
MAKSAAQKIQELQDELDEANDRIEELESHLRDGATLLDPEDLEDVLDEENEVDLEGDQIDEDDQ